MFQEAVHPLMEKYNVGSTSYMFLVDMARRDKKMEMQKIMEKTEIIKTVVCNWYGLPFEKLTGKTRRTEIVVPRQVLMTILKRNTSLPLREIGRMFGGRHYSTVIHAVETITGVMDVDEKFRKDVEFMEKRIQ